IVVRTGDVQVAVRAEDRLPWRGQPATTRGHELIEEFQRGAALDGGGVGDRQGDRRQPAILQRLQEKPGARWLAPDCTCLAVSAVRAPQGPGQRGQEPTGGEKKRHCLLPCTVCG